jgi:hypothetical protein
MYDTETRSTDRLAALVLSLPSTDHDAPVLRCSACAMECDTYTGAYDANPGWTVTDAIRHFGEHCAFDHVSPADILVTRIVRMIRLVSPPITGK